MNKVELIHQQLRLKHAQELLMDFMQYLDRNSQTVTIYEFQQFIGDQLEDICYNVEVNKNETLDNFIHIQKGRGFM